MFGYIMWKVGFFFTLFHIISLILFFLVINGEDLQAKSSAIEPVCSENLP